MAFLASPQQAGRMRIMNEMWCCWAGNGSQWPKMGRELIEQNATFRESIKICASVLTPMGLDLLEAFEKEDGFSEARLAAVGLASVQVIISPMTVLSAFSFTIAARCSPSQH
jgi:acyl transferase domain-containing protein